MAHITDRHHENSKEVAKIHIHLAIHIDKYELYLD